MYQLLYFKSAFQFDLKLDQMNARFQIPSSSSASQGLINILNLMLEADPTKRISCEGVWSLLDGLNDIQKNSAIPQQQLAGSLFI